MYDDTSHIIRARTRTGTSHHTVRAVSHLQVTSRLWLATYSASVIDISDRDDFSRRRDSEAAGVILFDRVHNLFHCQLFWGRDAAANPVDCRFMFWLWVSWHWGSCRSVSFPPYELWIFFTRLRSSQEREPLDQRLFSTAIQNPAVPPLSYNNWGRGLPVVTPWLLVMSVADNGSSTFPPARPQNSPNRTPMSSSARPIEHGNGRHLHIVLIGVWHERVDRHE